ncbi:MAG TPA: sugar phosphate nucleotidyltransferase [Thermomicrobiales bacterium]|nr:sugar phosphate nucleotidyltransferase [Thermomicrobiales bacterium]
MPRPKILALILAGGRGSRLEPLTEYRAKPAVPYAGVYRLIDISLSNLRNSGISDVGVIVQYETQSIISELANGRPWDLDRTTGGLRVIPPEQRNDRQGPEEVMAHGNADALYENLDVIRAYDADVVLVLSSDHIYRLDYFLPIHEHLERDADATLVTARVPIDDASNYGTCFLDANGRVTGFAYKPEKPESDIVTTEIFVYKPSALSETLERLAKDHEDELEDFGHGLIPELVNAGRVYEYRHNAYWKDVGRPETYFASHMDLLAADSELDLDDPAWPIFTLAPQRMPARIHSSARIAGGLISPGCDIAGTVECSVLAPGVVVEEGATVRNAIILENAVIKSGAEVQYAIVDRYATIGIGAKVGQALGGDQPGRDELALVGQYASVHGTQNVDAGETVEAVDPTRQA